MLKLKKLSEVIKEYSDPEFVIDKPREDAAECMEAMKGTYILKNRVIT